MDDDRGAESRGWAWVAALAASLGVALRVHAFLRDRSLWLDEAMLGLNICGRDLAGLLGPLDDDQAAPFGFLALERLSVWEFGANERALRLVPFLASLATLALAYRFCRRQFGGWGAAVGMIVFGLAPGLIGYAGEAKQYGVDVAAGLWILTLAADALRDGLSPRRAAMLAVAGAAVVWLSHPSVFVLAGAGTTLLAQQAVRRRLAPAALMAGASACWLASFAASYALSLRNLQSNAYLQSFWESGFLRFPPGSVKDVRQYVVVALGVFDTLFQNIQLEESLSERMVLVAAVAWGAGVLALWVRGRRGVVALLLSPLAVAVAASILHRYPLRFRLALFTAGPTLLAIAGGLAAMLRSADATSRAAARVILAGLLLLPAMQAAQALIERPGPDGARAVLARVARDWREGDLVLVDGGSGPAFRWYRAYGGIRGLDRVVPTLSRRGLGDPAKLAAGLPDLRDRARVWLLFSAHLPDRGGREARSIGLTLDHWGFRLDSAVAKGYYAHLYDFRAPAVASRGGPPRDREVVRASGPAPEE